MSRRTIAVLYGGRSSEHAVSLVSGGAVLRELHATDRFELVTIGIDHDGRWYLQDTEKQLSRARAGNPLEIATRPDGLTVIVPGSGMATAAGAIVPCDAVFPVLHGTHGEDGTVQGALELARLAYVGSGVTGSAIGMDKLRAKQLWLQNGLPVVPFLAFRACELDGGGLAAAAQQALNTLGSPLFVKPNAAGSSIGISKAHNARQAVTAMELALKYDSTILVERAIPAREIETAVLGNEEPVAFPPGEVVPSHEFYDYDAKYTDPNGAALIIPAELDPPTARRIQELAVAAFAACDGAGMARVDSFLDKETGAIYLNEINTIPGFTPISMYPKMAEAAGVGYGELLIRLIELAIARHAAREAHRYQ